jgi:hypothetical protein
MINPEYEVKCDDKFISAFETYEEARFAAWTESLSRRKNKPVEIYHKSEVIATVTNGKVLV